MSLSSNPFTTSAKQDDGKWGEIGGVGRIEGPVKNTAKEKRDAQLTTMELGGEYDPAQYKEFLEMLGIDRRVGQNGDGEDVES